MANFNFNKVILGGRLTADPELRQTPQGISVTTFTIAVNRHYSNSEAQQQADFITTVAWRKTAEFITKYFKKGSSICITGTVQSRNWVDANNQKRYSTEVIVDEVFFVDSKTESTPRPAFETDSFGQPAFSSMPIPEESNFEEMSSDDDLPF